MRQIALVRDRLGGEEDHTLTWKHKKQYPTNLRATTHLPGEGVAACERDSAAPSHIRDRRTTGQRGGRSRRYSCSTACSIGACAPTGFKSEAAVLSWLRWGPVGGLLATPVELPSFHASSNLVGVDFVFLSVICATWVGLCICCAGGCACT